MGISALGCAWMHILAKKSETLPSPNVQEALLCLVTMWAAGKGEIVLQTPRLPLS